MTRPRGEPGAIALAAPAVFASPVPSRAAAVSIVGSARLGDQGGASAGDRSPADTEAGFRTAPTTFSRYGGEAFRLAAEVNVAAGSAVTGRSWT